VSNTQLPPSPKTDAEALGLKLKDSDGGAQVVEIVPETPAARAEILAGDVITAVEAQPVKGAAACAKSIESSAQERRSKGVLLNLDRKGRRTFAVLKTSP